MHNELNLSADQLYQAMVEFAVANGLRREGLGSGWWRGEEIKEEATLGDAVEELIVEKYNIDVRNEINNEPTEYWG